MTGYPLAEPPPEVPRSAPPSPGTQGPPSRAARWARIAILAALLAAHAAFCLACQGGWGQVSSTWPIAWHDHPMHYHNAVITRSFLAQNGTTAGYDPYFMAGYAKSVISDASGTLIEVVVAAFGRDRPAMTYKMLVLAIMAALPCLVAGSIRLLGGGADAVLGGTSAFLVYLWTDFPLNYAGLGMISYLLAVPLGLFVLGLLLRFIERGGRGRWLVASIGSAALMLVHFLSAQTVGPAAAAAYLAAIISARRAGGRYPIGRHVGVLGIPIVILASNAFWWVPGIALARTRDVEGVDFFSHPESLWSRLGQILGLSEPEQGPIQVVLLGGAAVGLAALHRRRPIQAIGLGTFLASGVFWGYFAGGIRAFDFLQPGRNTYAAFSAGAVAIGLGWSAVRRRLAGGPGRLDRWATLAVLLISVRLFGPSLIRSVEYRTARDPVPSLVWRLDGTPAIRFFAPTGGTPFLSSRPAPVFSWLVDRVRGHFGPGDRILYEEGGQAGGGLNDPFGGARFGGLLPTLSGVEVIGGPFLHVAVRQNFTQFGMGRLCGLEDWGREEFERYARLYRPAGIVCWSPRSRAFCRDNPDLCEILDEREPIMIARIRGFEGDAIRGRATVRAVAGRLEVEPIAADVDGMIVLRYHTIPGLRSDPPGLLRAVEEPGDPVPFIGLDRPEGPLTIEWGAPP